MISQREASGRTGNSGGGVRGRKSGVIGWTLLSVITWPIQLLALVGSKSTASVAMKALSRIGPEAFWVNWEPVWAQEDDEEEDE